MAQEKDMNIEETEAKNIKLSEIFLIFLKIGSFTIGGGLAMLPLIQKEMINRGWIGENEFLDMITLSQTIPGPIAINISTNVGYRLRGVKGALVSVCGCIFPSIIITTLIAGVFTNISSNPQVVAAFNGIRAAITGIIAVTLYKLIFSVLRASWQWIVAIACFFFIAILKVSPAILVVIALLIGIFKKPEEKSN